MTHVLSLTPSVRDALKEPLGSVYDTPEDALGDSSSDVRLFTVGDVVTGDCYAAGYTPATAVVDYKTRRTDLTAEQRQHLPEPTHRTRNEAGGLSRMLALTLRSALAAEGSSLVLVDGEEDLAVLPLILLANREDIILYGQPQEGVVKLVITEAVREQARSRLKAMDGPSDTYIDLLQGD